MAQWYARYNTAQSNRLEEANYNEQSDRDRWAAMPDMAVTVGFDIPIPNLVTPGTVPPTYLKKYDPVTHEISDL
jgi:hypothetical protein